MYKGKMTAFNYESGALGSLGAKQNDLEEGGLTDISLNNKKTSGEPPPKPNIQKTRPISPTVH